MTPLAQLTETDARHFPSFPGRHEFEAGDQKKMLRRGAIVSVLGALVCLLFAGVPAQASKTAPGGMWWQRNGKTQGANAGHPAEYCGYQYHAAFNPDHDYDFINHSDTLDFEIEVDGQVGSADVVAHGSFTSAGCTSERDGRWSPDGDADYSPIIKLPLETCEGDRATFTIWQPDVEQFSTLSGIRENLLRQLEDWLPETRLH